MAGFNNKMTRRRFLEGMALAAGSAAFAGCGEVPSTAGKGDISFMNWEETMGTPLGDAIKEFEKQSGKKVTIQPAPEGDAYDTKVRTVLASGVPPDVMRTNDDFVRGFSKENNLTDLSKYIKEDVNTSDYYTEPFDFPRQPDGSYTAWVLGFQPRLIYYNVDMFKEAGVELPPSDWSSDGWTWDDFLATARKLTGGRRWGALVYYDTGYEQTFAINNGSQEGIYSENGKQFTFAEPRAVEAVQWATDLTCEHHVQPPWSELQQEGIDSQLFAQGRLGMVYGVMGYVPYFRETVKDFEWDVAPVPANVEQRTEASLIVFSIPRKAQRPDAGWDLLDFLGSSDGGDILAKGSQFIPINRKSAGLIQPSDQPPASLDLFVESADHLTAVNKTNDTLRARQIYRPALEKVYNCDASAQQVLSEVRPEVEKALVGRF